MRAYLFIGLFLLGFVFASLVGPMLKSDESTRKLSTQSHSPANSILTVKADLLNNIKKELTLRDMTGNSYHYLRSESFHNNPEMYIAIAPEVRSFAIESLVSRLNESDWVLWKENLTSYSGVKSDARRWLDGIKVVNFELGRYLETSALLYSELYLASAMGKVYSVEEELYELSTEAPALFQAVTPKAYSPRINLDTSLTTDPSFIIWIERLRAQFVVNYAKRQPKQLETQLSLLASVKQEFHTPEVIQNYVHLLRFISKEISPKYRLELKDHYFQSGREQELIVLSEDFSVSFTAFYIQCFNDALAEREIPRAKSILLKFGGYFPKSSLISGMQDQISSLESEKKSKVVEEQNNVKKVSVIEASNSKVGFSDYLSGVSDQSSLRDLVERIGMWIIMLLVVGLAVIKSIPLVILFSSTRRIRRERSEAEMREKEDAQNQNEEEDISDNKGKMIPINKPLASRGRKNAKAPEKRVANS